ncbi:hypothetical protein DYB25_006384 [Aphanomyces astaci]|uniref:BZIP domain-containing protein n=1 Tax=Aphanomyces astaci TaxID=112090 RepID=A0A397BL87_APHAT|nr:hypothetical protein DYB25_006384 [Aphanomyces astaci]RHY71174.1 hypothetical protein DYB34_012805 [Aphanomyces astaci]
MSFSFHTGNMSDVDMMFDVDPVPFGDIDISSPDADLDRHDLDMLINPLSHHLHTISGPDIFQTYHQQQHSNHHMVPPSAPAYGSQQSTRATNEPIKVETSRQHVPPPSTTNGFRLPSQNSGAVSPPSSETSRSHHHFQTDEELLAQPVGSLTEEEKKLRRRAQVAKSARKHRKGVKEELEMLRQQVKYLQEQMAIKCAVVAEDDAARKRQKAENGGVSPAAAATTPASTSPQTSFHHIYAHLNANVDDRRLALINLADRTMSHAVSMVMADQTRDFPYFDVSLNNRGPDMQFQLVRGKVIPDVDHRTLACACWNSVLDFSFDIQRRSLKGLVEYEVGKTLSHKIMNLDDDTRYGRIKMPILKSSKKDKQLIFMESLFLVRRKIYDKHSVIMWNSIDHDDLFPEHADGNTLRNVEVGCAVLEHKTMPNGDKSTIMRCVVRSMPPVRALAEPRGKISEAFLTTWCRCSDFFDDVTRTELRKFAARQTTPTVTLQSQS